MLQHYSPYKVAENFNVLASLAPGRVDLGIGRGPGGLPRSTNALQQGMGQGAKPLAEKLLELQQFLRNELEANHPLYGLRDSAPQPAGVFTGTTPRVCAGSEPRAPYVFALFLNRDATYQMTGHIPPGFDAAGHALQAILALRAAADTAERCALCADRRWCVFAWPAAGR
jgi:alkanesulfonate monooxygenase SsuD/methylene tetrahydromethanopterin reductase-like flavin-dependent oxidoreductase (luciferase family)